MIKKRRRRRKHEVCERKKPYFVRERERERAVVVVGLGARDKQDKTTRVINFKV